MNEFILASTVIAIAAYFPLWKQIRSGSAKQNLLTWLLWGALDGVVAATIIAQKGNYFLAATYTIGTFITVAFIAVAGDHASWTWFETMVVTLVAVSMGIWYFSGSKMATIVGTSAMLIAGVPQLVDTWKKPAECPTLVYFVYIVANCLATAGGKNWAVEERFYPISAAIFCFLVAAISLRRFFHQTTGLTIPGESSS